LKEQAVFTCLYSRWIFQEQLVIDPWRCESSRRKPVLLNVEQKTPGVNLKVISHDKHVYFRSRHHGVGGVEPERDPVLIIAR